MAAIRVRIKLYFFFYFALSFDTVFRGWREVKRKKLSTGGMPLKKFNLRSSGKSRSHVPMLELIFWFASVCGYRFRVHWEAYFFCENSSQGIRFLLRNKLEIEVNCQIEPV